MGKYIWRQSDNKNKWKIKICHLFSKIKGKKKPIELDYKFSQRSKSNIRWLYCNKKKVIDYEI